MSLIGRPLRRVEDRRFVTGRGEYVDDVAIPGVLHVALVRSTYAHATIRGIDAAEARAMPGVVAVVTAADLGAANGPHPHPTWFPPHPPLVKPVNPFTRPERIWLLAADKVRYAGEAVAAVIATDRYLAEDAATAVLVDYDPLPVLADPERSLRPDAPLLNPEWGDNRAVHFVVEGGDVEAAFSGADVVVKRRLRYGRAICTPIENRGVAAMPDRRGEGLTVWSSSQQPHWLRDALERTLRIPGDRLRVIAPDVGGGFGLKSMVYPEELLIPRLALTLGRPLKWIETRRENLTSATHTRDQVHEIELAVDRDGTIRGLRDRYVIDGGIGSVESIVVPYNTACHLPGAYRIPAMRMECTVGVTNKPPSAAERGAGRPEAAFALESILDAAAAELGMDRAAFRLHNALRKDEMPHDHGIPYRDGVPLRLDAGDFRADAAEALRLLGYEGWLARQRGAPGARGPGDVGTGDGVRDDDEVGDRLLGIGMSGCVDEVLGCGFHAAVVSVDPDSGGVEFIRYVAVHDDGRTLPPASSDTPVHGGIALGIGSGLFEELVYDDNGQLLTGSLTDYVLPRATDLPTPVVVHRGADSDHHLPATEFVSAAAAVPGAALVLGAVADALGPAGRYLDCVPVTPVRILAAIARARADGVPVGHRAVDPGTSTSAAGGAWCR